MSLALWSLERKCSETAVGLEMLVRLSTGLRCSLKRSLSPPWSGKNNMEVCHVIPVLCKLYGLHGLQGLHGGYTETDTNFLPADFVPNQAFHTFFKIVTKEVKE